jgi:aspartate carbamoyltransferase regulatory subunit
MELECDYCGETFDPDDEVESEFYVEDEETGEIMCALCNASDSVN